MSASTGLRPGHSGRGFLLYAWRAKMSEKESNRSPEPLFKVRQIFILFALVLVFSFAVRLASGDPLPHDIRDFFSSVLGLGAP
jgi:hypothetical protein